MRRLLAVNCPGAELLEGAAEAIQLPGAAVDTVFAAECFHRFDGDAALAEIARVLRPGGALVLLWNLPAGPWEPSVEAVERLLAPHLPHGGELGYDPYDLNTDRYSSGAWRDPFSHSSFAALEETWLPNPQTLDPDGLVAFLASMGWIGDLPDDERLPLLREVRALLDAPAYRRLWETRRYVAPLPG
jgi:SAM-dependent methyltransferase